MKEAPVIRGKDLENRTEGAQGIEDAEEAIRKMKGTKNAPADPAGELAALKERIEAARRLPPPSGVNDGAVWANGRDAAIKAIEGVE
jgi:hypothetical protein